MGLFESLVKHFSGPRCNICGGRRFLPGPHRRLSAMGRKPRCARCHSLERHRGFRRMFLGLDPGRFRSLRCVQFSRDAATDARWFERFELSIYGEQNSLDLQRIDRPDGSYDAVICNHVLEHVADHRAALRELARVLSTRGFLFLSFPDPYNLEHTTDWGYPNPDLFGHYRHFGRDVEEVLRREMPNFFIVAVTTEDEITGTGDMAYVVTRSPEWFRRACELKLQTRICAQPFADPARPS